MRFMVHKRRQAPAVIIVALIDVLVVLVIFLVVTTTFRHQPALKLALPESSQATKAGVNENAPFIIFIDDKGDLRVGSDAHPTTADRLPAELAEAFKKNDQLRLSINADKSAPFGKIVKVMDCAKEAGIKSVSAFTKEAKP